MAHADRSARIQRVRWRRFRFGAAAMLAAGALIATLVAPGVSQAEAVGDDGFPTWAEVEAARASESAKNQQISELRDLIAQLETDAADAQELADQRAADAIEAQRVYDEAVATAERLQEQADEASANADESRRAAGQLSAQLARAGGSGDLSAELFANPGTADAWLHELDMLDRVAGTADTLYERAQQDANTAQTLQDQAAVARDALAELKDAAEEAYAGAQATAIAAQEAVVAQQEHRVELQAQLEVLTENRLATEDDYQAGERHRAWLAEQERLRREREEREREQARQRALEEQRRLAQATRSQEGSSGGAAVVPVAPTNNGGWQTPLYGRFTSAYGMRNDPVGRLGLKLHAGVDIAAGCGAPIYAAADGVVTLRSRDIYGANMLYIDHGNGVQTEYYHMMQPASVVPGQRVRAGQVVAYEGRTGYVTGCHLHFQLRVGGTLVNPESFLNARGVYLR